MPLYTSFTMTMSIPSSRLNYNYNCKCNGSLTPQKTAVPPKLCMPRCLNLSNRRASVSASASEPMLSSSSSGSSSAVKDGRISVTESSQFSITDSQLNSRGFELHRTADNLDLDQLNALFVKVGFVRREEKKLRLSLCNTSSLVWLEYKKTGKVVAFARATGDDVYNAVIWDVVVDPSFQSCGLGKAVMERLMADLLAKGITNIALYAEPGVLGFYRPLGFIADPDGIKAMVFFKKNGIRFRL